MLLLRVAGASTQGMPVTTYHMGAHLDGFHVSLGDVERELQYLLDKNFICEVPKVLSPENRRYRIHAVGRDFLAEHRFTEEITRNT